MATRTYDIIAVADMCVDLMLDLGGSEPRFGQVEQWVEDYFLELGGSANIFACQAARLGARVAVIGRVGDDAYGRLAMRRLAECGVDTRHVTLDAGLKTGIGVALCRSGGDRAILTYAGSISAVGPEDISDKFLRSGRHLHYCSYYLQTRLLPHAPMILRRAREMGLTVSLDTNWDPEGRWQGGLRDALAAADLFLPNEQEAIAVAGTLAPDPVPSLDEAVSRLVARGPVVVVKQGERGALVADREHRVQVPVEPVAHVGDTIGAGDCFDAGFVVAWLDRRPLAECAALGNACGRASTQARGGIAGQTGRGTTV